MLALIPTFHYDAQLALETQDTWQTFQHIQAPVLLLGGSNSPPYLKTALTALEHLLDRSFCHPLNVAPINAGHALLVRMA